MFQCGVFMPYFVVYLIGLILAVTRWHRHPRASTFAFWGFLILIADGVVMSALQVWLLNSVVSSNMSGSQTSTYSSIIGAARTLINSVGFALLVAAIFVGRRDESQPLFREPPPELPQDRPPEIPRASEPQTGIRERRVP